MSNKSIVICMVIVLVLIAQGIYGQTYVKPYDFTAGDPALASEVNANFDDLYTAANGLDARVDAIIESPWTVDTSKVFYEGGTVGIGTSTIDSVLTVSGKPPLTGTVSVSAGTSTVTGTGTAFTSEVASGDFIEIAGEIIEAASVSSDTVFTLVSSHTGGATGVTAYPNPSLLKIQKGNGTDALVIDRNGYVGIGTGSMTPVMRLHVDGNIMLEDELFLGNATGTTIKGGTTLSLRTSSIDRLTVDNTGNVGIGTTTPGAKLEVNGDLKVGAYTLPSTDGTNSQVLVTNGSGTLTWTDNGAGSNLWTQSGSDIFYTSGNVGIGSITPMVKLEVNGTINATAFTGDGSGLTGVVTTESDPKVGAVTIGYSPKWDGSALVTGAIFQDGSGNVGIGTTNPGAKLEVLDGSIKLNSPAEGNSEVFFTGNTGNLEGLKIWYNNASAASYFDNVYNQDNANMYFRTRTAGTPRDALTILGNGNVGIGTTAPGAGFEVAGQVKITGGIPGAGKVLTSDADGLATWENTSGDNLGNHTAAQNILLNSNWLSGDGGSEGIYVDSAGNVGVGTPTLGSKLVVKGSGTTSTTSALNITDGGGTSLLYVRDDGNVGIGTTNPGAKLEFGGDIIYSKW